LKEDELRVRVIEREREKGESEVKGRREQIDMIQKRAEWQKKKKGEETAGKVRGECRAVGSSN
jgi:hypothetical protein